MISLTGAIARPCAASASLLAWLLMPLAAGAQTTDPCVPAAQTSCEEVSFSARAMQRYRELRLKGITPMIGTIVPGASLSAGVELRRDRLFHLPVGASIETMWSIRGYHEYDLRIGRIRGNHSRAELRPFGEAITGMFSDGALLAPGISYAADIRQRVYPRVDFFGLGQQSRVGDRSDFGIQTFSIDGLLQWQHNRHFGVSVRGGKTAMSLEPGTNRGVVDLGDRYDENSAPGLLGRPVYRALGVAAIVDYRDKAQLTSSGSWMGVAWWKAADINSPAGSGFTRVSVDARHFIAVPDADHVLALRTIVSTHVDADNQPTPFYLLPTLGGSKTLRGFGSYRLRGDTVWTASAEYRWHVQRRIEVVPFVDVGGVADRFAAIGNTPVAVAPGVGVRARTNERVVGRLDFASGRDGQRLVLTLSAPF